MLCIVEMHRVRHQTSRDRGIIPLPVRLCDVRPEVLTSGAAIFLGQS